MNKVFQWLLGFIAFYLAASLSLFLTRHEGSIAIVWYANAIAGAYLSICPKSRWPLILTGMALGNVLADLPYSRDLLQTSGFLPGNLLETYLVALLLRKHVFNVPVFSTPVKYLKGIVTVSLCSAALGACLGAIALSKSVGMGFEQAWIIWFEGSLIGGVSVLPVITIWNKLSSKHFFEEVLDIRSLLSIAGSLTVTWASLLHLPYPFVYIVAILSVTCFYTSVTGVVVASTAVAIFSMTLVAIGIYAPASPEPINLLLFYVPLLAVVLGPSLFAVAMANSTKFRKRSQELAKSYEDMYFNSPAILHSIDGSGNLVSVSKKWLDLLGYERSEVIGQPSINYLSPECRERAKQEILPEFFRKGFCNDVRYTMLCADGKEVDVLLSAILERDSEGQPVRSLAFLKDISTEIALQEDLRRERDYMTETLSSITDCIIATDEAGLITFANDAVVRLSGYSSDQMRGKPVSSFFLFYSEDSRSPYADPIRRCQESGGIVQEVELVSVLGGSSRELAAEFTASPIRGPDNEISGVSLILHDVTEAREANKKMAYLAHHDTLTGLPNRNLFREQLEERCATCTKQNTFFSLLFLDIDNFKSVNDSLGHQIGDELLKAVASRLSRIVRKNDAICRFGGDEFVIIVNHSEGKGQIEYLCERIKQTLASPITLSGTEFRVRSSIGIVQFPNDGTEPETLLRRADSAMYRAKDYGKDGVVFYHQEIESSITEEFETERALKSAIDKGDDISVHFQPIIDSEKGSIFALEALVRWRHEGEMIPTPLFIRVAENTGLISSLSLTIFDKAFQQLAEWKTQKDRTPSLSLNLSGAQFGDTALVDKLRSYSKQYDIEMSQLIFEITETSLIREPDRALSILKELKALGCRIAIDDFGTGYSSLSQIKKYPIDIIKIDKEFVSGLSRDSQDTEFVTFIIKMAEVLGLDVIGEGVETDKQAALLSSLGCTNHQGYFYDKPMPGSDMGDKYFSGVVSFEHFRSKLDKP